MSSSHEPIGGNDRFELSQVALSPEERCLADLFDMTDVDPSGAYQRTGEFYAAISGYTAPEDLGTRIHPTKVSSDERPSSIAIHPVGADVVATVNVGFSVQQGSMGMHNIDFVRTEQGLKVYEKGWFDESGERVPKYVSVLSETQLTALSADAKKIAQTVVDTDAERLKLGTLVEAADANGLRRFHVGDILTIITGKLVSGRGVEGIYDILGYMTDDSPFTTQLGRFSDECKPYLHEQFDATLAAYYEPPKEALKDAVSCFRWLNEVSRQLGEPLLPVTPIAQDRHAQMDVLTEFELDHGSEIMKKVITFDAEDLDQSED